MKATHEKKTQMQYEVVKKSYEHKRARNRRRSVRDSRDASNAVSLPDDVMQFIFSMLSRGELARCALVSSSWARQASTSSLWDELCRRTWSGRYVSDETRALRPTEPAKALQLSLTESKQEFITEEELCKLTWSFRFKEAAGEDWTDTDPWWLGEKARTLRFMPDGRVTGDDPNDSDSDLMHWKLYDGCILRVSHVELGGFPAEKLIRHKTNWGFIFHSTWVVYTSFPMERCTDDVYVSDAALSRRLRQWQHREAHEYNEGELLDSSDEYDDDDDDDGDDDDGDDDDDDQDVEAEDGEAHDTNNEEHQTEELSGDDSDADDNHHTHM